MKLEHQACDLQASPLPPAPLLACWLAGWLWLACWLAGWLAAGWLAGWGEVPKSRQPGNWRVNWRTRGVGTPITDCQTAILQASNSQSAGLQATKLYTKLKERHTATSASPAWWPQGAGGYMYIIYTCPFVNASADKIINE